MSVAASVAERRHLNVAAGLGGAPLITADAPAAPYAQVQMVYRSLRVRRRGAKIVEQCGLFLRHRGGLALCDIETGYAPEEYQSCDDTAN